MHPSIPNMAAIHDQDCTPRLSFSQSPSSVWNIVVVFASSLMYIRTRLVLYLAFNIKDLGKIGQQMLFSENVSRLSLMQDHVGHFRLTQNRLHDVILWRLHVPYSMISGYSLLTSFVVMPLLFDGQFCLCSCYLVSTMSYLLGIAALVMKCFCSRITVKKLSTKN